MKLLLEKNIILTKECLNFSLMLEDENSHGSAKAENEVGYILYVHIPKTRKLKSIDVAKNIKDILSEYFLSSSKYKKALYVPKTCEINSCGEGYIDVFYDLKYKHAYLDKGYETEDNEIGKNLMSIQLDYSNRVSDVLKIEFKSLFLVDEMYNMQTLWEIDNGKVYDFLLEEISEKICE